MKKHKDIFRTRFFILITFMSFLVFSFHCSAQVSHGISIHIPDMAAIRLKPGSSQSTNFDFNKVSELTQGQTKNNTSTYQVRSNTDWVVSAKAANSYFSNSGQGSSVNMPCSVLEIKSGTSGDGFVSLSMMEQALDNGKPGDFGNQNEFNIDYKVKPDLSFAAGTYRMEVILTVSSY